ncbi:UdgX family uracil-DNA binding protein [Hydrocarboniphaga sp.]|uniref:UdgX family uracil-DNA binding protein n=1 Tax=Hydrocarboniphaga sp. TaxID=2033016 RepID=UPI003D0C0C7E
MISVQLQDGVDFAQWRGRARALLQAEIAPEHVTWIVGSEASLFGGGDEALPPPPAGASQARVPREFMSLADRVIAHRDPQRHALLYRMLWRLTHGEPQLMKLITDDDVAKALAHSKNVGRDLHKMTAFVRFRELARGDELPPVFVSWFEPEHYIVERVAPFFVRRFAGMHWSILTPYRSAHWDGSELRFDRGATRDQAPSDDLLEELWRSYYASIFNPARLKIGAMKSEMPVKYWKNLPEARLIPQLIRDAPARAQAMVAAAPTVPRKRISEAAAPRIDAPFFVEGSLADVRAQAKDCRRCPLWEPATQTVFGVGPEDARIMLIGEQPGDKEDLGGKPFAGPAGQLLDQALLAAGLDRAAMYVTNTVKHFKFEARGKERLHKRAGAREQAACRPWLDAELARVQPQIIVCLGSMAASALFGSDFKLLQQRGQWRELGNGVRAIATVHPAYLLRLPEQAARDQGYRDFVRDLQMLSE